ncbi:cystathionine beta-synthase domain-containing protein [Gottschalkia acidurici 9a]|uniref:Cystathionine beta-synthase domain-containing protein n=1 Tax=Gottschalkia acidurici (strain ATCC 7906 / DSM 604 / BCRC 14475 / CIP 104303 / KCTC 5404 / NCIMB 10678 / 9a) TaxID=1128398 RepID=K0AXZ9_GOTA9|nr:CBS domain-containing protein [Gottschalkia acidurici]AFS78084.1 cystathionine beta-synthase domain-containing protein [Gottschalkia acidurici 9a]
MKIKDIMTHNVSTISSSSSIQDAAREMKELDVGVIPVMCSKTKQNVGLLTDRDIIVRAISEGKSLSSSVKDIMSANPITVSPDTEVSEAAKLMSQNQIRRLPVVEKGKLVGIVSLGDLAVDNKCSHKAGSALSSISESTPFTTY